MSFATVLPYALIVDGPQALRWWGTAGDAGGAWPAAAATDSEGDGDDDAVALATSFASLWLYLGVSGVLLFLHSAVRSHTCQFFSLRGSGFVSARCDIKLAGAIILTWDQELVHSISICCSLFFTPLFLNALVARKRIKHRQPSRS